MSHWSAAYIGLAWDEVGTELCWGLVRKILAERASVAVPSYEPLHCGDSDDLVTISALLRSESAGWPWLPIPPGQERELDVAVFRRGGIESHVGVVVGPSRIIHLARGYDARVESFASGRWRTRLVGIYRHQDLLARHEA